MREAGDSESQEVGILSHNHEAVGSCEFEMLLVAGTQHPGTLHRQHINASLPQSVHECVSNVLISVEPDCRFRRHLAPPESDVSWSETGRVTTRRKRANL